ncbi:MAG: YceI family protein [Saprospiraceae bacterium]|nr:YceI family protein [Saprospiraceae bacterium]
MKKYLLLLLLLPGINLSAQRYLTKTAYVKFFSSTPLEKIDAVSNTSACILDISNGNLEFSVLNTSFQFKKALMQQHFNENYIESSKFPKSKFRGTIQNLGSIDFSKSGAHQILINGDMNIHGITKQIVVPATLKIENSGKIIGEAKFKVKPEDYSIKIPSLVKDNIAKEIEITVKLDLTKM